MSESNGYAKKESLASKRSQRRYIDFEWPTIGKVVLQSAMAGEFVRIDASRQRATLAAVGGRIKEHEKATQDFLLNICLLLVLDGDRNPFFAPEDKDLILSLDSALTDALCTACLEHCGLEASLGDAQKN